MSREGSLKAVKDPLVQITNVDGQYAVLMLKEDGQLESELQLKRMPESDANTN